MLHQTIKSQIKEALRARDTIRLDVLRGLNALFQNELLTGAAPIKGEDGMDYLSDDKALPLVKRSVKQRKDSIEQFEKGGRPDLADKEKAELEILGSFLPAMMSPEEVRLVVHQRITTLKAEGAIDPKSTGKIVGMLMKELTGKADGSDVKAAVEEVLQ